MATLDQDPAVRDRVLIDLDLDHADDAELRRVARQRLEDRRGFASHVFVYVMANAVIWLIWLVVAFNSGAWFPWAVFPTAGWGIGLAANAWAVYGERPITTGMVDAEVDRLRRRASTSRR